MRRGTGEARHGRPGPDMAEQGPGSGGDGGGTAREVRRGAGEARRGGAGPWRRRRGGKGEEIEQGDDTWGPYVSEMEELCKGQCGQYENMISTYTLARGSNGIKNIENSISQITSKL